MESGTVIYKAFGKVWWVDSGHQPSTTQLFWLQQDRGDNRKSKGEKTCGLETFNKQNEEE